MTLGSCMEKGFFKTNMTKLWSLWVLTVVSGSEADLVQCLLVEASLMDGKFLAAEPSRGNAVPLLLLR